MADENKKVEHVNGGEVREFSAIHGEKKSAIGPAKTSCYEDKKAIAKINIKKD